MNLNALAQPEKNCACGRLGRISVKQRGQGALNGKYNHEVFNGLLQAMVTKLDREKRGIGLQNFPYAPAWEEMSHLLWICNPCAYRSLKEYLPTPNERTIRYEITLKTPDLDIRPILFLGQRKKDSLRVAFQ